MPIFRTKNIYIYIPTKFMKYANKENNEFKINKKGLALNK